MSFASTWALPIYLLQALLSKPCKNLPSVQMRTGTLQMVEPLLSGKQLLHTIKPDLT